MLAKRIVIYYTHKSSYSDYPSYGMQSELIVELTIYLFDSDYPSYGMQSEQVLGQVIYLKYSDYPSYGMQSEHFILLRLLTFYSDYPSYGMQSELASFSILLNGGVYEAYCYIGKYYIIGEGVSVFYTANSNYSDDKKIFKQLENADLRQKLIDESLNLKDLDTAK